MTERIASAPARVNLLGEHIDHQGGTVLPTAVHLRTTVTYTPGDAWIIESEDHEPGGDWTRYVEAMVDALEAPTPGRLAIASTIPEHKGLASSAALEVAIAGALSDLTPLDLARLCRKVENDALGVPCGFMDQAAAACAIQGNVLVLDCASETFFHLPLPECELLLFDTGVARRLSDTPYAERVEEARTAGTLAAQHVADEMARVEAGIEMLEHDDLVGFGDLMNECHASLRDLYRCSTPAIDAMVDQIARLKHVHGARLMGAGWGGYILALAEPSVVPEGAIRLISDDGLYRLQ